MINNIHLFEQFSSGSYLVINKQLLKKYGPEPAIFISNLIDKFLYFYRTRKDGNLFFFQTHERQIEATGISEYAIRKHKAFFKNLGVLEAKMSGQPAKEMYKININILIKDVYQESALSSSSGQDLSEPSGIDLSSSIGIIDKEPRDKEPRDKVINNFKGFDKPKEDSAGFFEETSQEDFLLNSVEHECLIYWNSLPNVFHHLKKGTKVRKQAGEYIAQLNKGVFGQKKVFCPDFFNKYEVPIRQLTQKWGRKELKEGLLRLSLLYQDGYWPRDKDRLPNNLPALFFNVSTRKSRFLMVMSKKPELILNQMVEIDTTETKTRPLVENLLLIFKNEGVIENPIQKTRDEVKELVEYHSKINFESALVKYRYGNIYDFVNRFCLFLNDQGWLTGIINLAPRGKLFQMFIDDLESEFYNKYSFQIQKEA